MEDQVAAACTGIAERVKELQTATGVKDMFTQFWIENLIERSRSMKKLSPNLTSQDIKDQLLDWVQENRTKIYNPFLLSIKGE